MGMLGRIMNSVGTAAETIGTMKLKQISEEELLDKKAALEEAREQRILEAQAKAEERANLEWSRRNEIDQGFKMTENQYRINQENERFDKETERQKGMLTLGHQLGREDADYKNKLDNDPNDIDYQVKASQLGAHELQKEKARLELDNEKQTLALKDKILNGTPEEQAEAINKINMLSGKDKPIIKTAKVQFGVDENQKPIMGDALYREENGKVQWINPQDELRKLNPTMGMSDADVEALATEMTDKQIGARNSTSMFIPNDGVDNTKEYDDALAANKVKVKSGMLNSNNFGNVRNNNDKGFKEFKTPEDGINAIAGRLDRYADGITTKANPDGKPATTLLEFTSIYAPKQDNNDPVAYAKFLSKETGIGINEKVDLSDPEIQKMLVPLIMLQENRPRAEKALQRPEVKRAIANIGADKNKAENETLDPLGLRKGS